MNLAWDRVRDPSNGTAFEGVGVPLKPWRITISADMHG
ncbi:hypothetical protein N826_25655 [Skermanella aerolata KACC 11604]|nr:hypothetical protein N826_25655 [Skermanella aerolata KACC 11604]